MIVFVFAVKKEEDRNALLNRTRLAAAGAKDPPKMSLIHSSAPSEMIKVTGIETSTIPSLTPASSTAAWTSSVMRTNSRRRWVLNVR